MTDIISEIINIEETAARVAEKARKKADELEKTACSEIDGERRKAQERTKKSAAEFEKKISAQTTAQIREINLQTEQKLKKMTEYYDINKEKIISELFDKALKL